MQPFLKLCEKRSSRELRLWSQWHRAIWKIGDESGVRVLIRIIGGRVFYHGDLVAKLTGKAPPRKSLPACLETGAGP